jgi:hypothetical protein
MTELAAALPVDVMPGPDDPANVSLPQQPLHHCESRRGWRCGMNVLGGGHAAPGEHSSSELRCLAAGNV